MRERVATDRECVQEREVTPVMVEQISASQGRSVADALLSRRSDAAEATQTLASLSPVGPAGQTEAPSGISAFLDNADVSDQARRLLAAARFGKLAQELPDTDGAQRADRVAHLRLLVAHGRLSEAARQYDNATLADDLLNSPTGAMLR